MYLSRRCFIQRTAGALFATGSAGAWDTHWTWAEETEASLPIIDTHQHLWDLSKVHPPWLKPERPICRNYVMEDYLAAARGLNIVKAVYMEIAVAPEDLMAEADYVLDLCRRRVGPTRAAVLGGRPGHPEFKQYISRFRGNPYVKGIRQIIRSAGKGPSPLLSEEFVEGIRLLGILGMRFDICVPPGLLPDTVKLVDLCPDTRFVLDHCGNADPLAFGIRAGKTGSHDADTWRRDVAALARRKNVVCKISGVVSRAPEDWKPEDLAPIVNHCLAVFGPQRVMFAGDWPVCTSRATLGQWVGALKTLVQDRPRAEQRRLFHDNAAAFYGLG